MIAEVRASGRGFDVGNLDVPVTTSVALDRGDIVQLVQTAGGIWQTCTGAGAGNIAITGGEWEQTGNILIKTGAFTNYTFKSGDRLRVTAGTGATAGFYVVASKVDADSITLATSIGAGADEQTDIAATLLDRTLMHGIFGCALTRADASGRVVVRVIGVCEAFTKNSADAAIAAGNLYAATSAKDLDSDTASYGINAKLVAKAVGTALVSTTATRALRKVLMNGLFGWGGTYGGTA